MLMGRTPACSLTVGLLRPLHVPSVAFARGVTHRGRLLAEGCPWTDDGVRRQSLPSLPLSPTWLANWPDCSRGSGIRPCRGLGHRPRRPMSALLDRHGSPAGSTTVGIGRPSHSLCASARRIVSSPRRQPRRTALPTEDRFLVLFWYHQEKSTWRLRQVLDSTTVFGRRDWTRTNDPHHVKVVPSKGTANGCTRGRCVISRCRATASRLIAGHRYRRA